MIEKSKTKKKSKNTSKEKRNNDLINNIIKDKDNIRKNMKNIKNIVSDEEKKKIFAPDIRDTNNILIRHIKTILKEKHLSEKELRQRFESMGEWNNFKRALIIRDSITIEGFARWMEVLKVDWHIEFDE